MPPSDIAICKPGKRRKTPEKRMSVIAVKLLTGVSEIITSGGASGAVTTIDDEEPMCRHTVTAPSTHAAKNGSQCSVW